MTAKLKVGDEVWMVRNWVGVKSRITQVDDGLFEEYGESASIFYWVDEPVGHSLADDEYYLSREEAEKALLDILKDVIHSNETEEHPDYIQEIPYDATLDEARQRTIDFIVSTWDLSPEQVEEEKARWRLELPKKEHGTDWFNLNDLRRK
jgi:hypothetical protein